MSGALKSKEDRKMKVDVEIENGAMLFHQLPRILNCDLV